MNLKSYGGGRLNIIGQIEVGWKEVPTKQKQFQPNKSGGADSKGSTYAITHWHRLTFFSWGAIPIERTKDASERDTI